jgi:hypothetical protein
MGQALALVPTQNKNWIPLTQKETLSDPASRAMGEERIVN